jgi:hypothetical protein
MTHFLCTRVKVPSTYARAVNAGAAAGDTEQRYDSADQYYQDSEQDSAFDQSFDAGGEEGRQLGEDLAAAAAFPPLSGPQGSDAETLCPYMLHKGACPYLEQCHYLHGDVCDMCGLAILHPTDSKQRDQHMQVCVWFYYLCLYMFLGRYARTKPNRLAERSAK